MTHRFLALLFGAAVSAAACSPRPETAQAATQAAPDRSAGQASPLARHPLDPLTEDEIRIATQTARADARFATAAFHAIAAAEPAKSDVLSWQLAQPLPRSAAIRAVTAEGIVEIAVDVAARGLPFR